MQQHPLESWWKCALVPRPHLLSQTSSQRHPISSALHLQTRWSVECLCILFTVFFYICFWKVGLLFWFKNPLLSIFPLLSYFCRIRVLINSRLLFFFCHVSIELEVSGVEGTSKPSGIGTWHVLCHGSAPKPALRGTLLSRPPP